MKAIFFGCIIIFLASCEKPTFDLNWSSEPYVEVYTWGNWNYNTSDSSNKVTAEFISHGNSVPFTAITSNARFTNFPNMISIYAYDASAMKDIGISLHNVLTTGVYTIPASAGSTATVSLITLEKGYPSDSTTLTGTVTIDTLTSSHIHGVFTLKAVSATNTVEMNNGSFTGNF
jgi:hypothetical protein